MGDRRQVTGNKKNPDFVLSRASLHFGSGYVDCTNFVRAALAY